jgi:hypothetical protein
MLNPTIKKITIIICGNVLENFAITIFYTKYAGFFDSYFSTVEYGKGRLPYLKISFIQNGKFCRSTEKIMW